MIEQAFEVATEFRFDIGQALVNTDALKGAVDDLSKSASSALGSLNYLASGLVAHLGLGSGGLLSLLSKCVQVSEAFNNSSLQFANNISSNISVLSGTIDNFNDRLETSKMLMGNISSTAIKFGLDTHQLASVAQLIATPLAARGKLGTNYAGAINMGKNLLMGSEAVGLHPQVASESLYRALTEHMPLHGALFARMVNTPAFKSAHISTQQQLMTMNQDKKIDLLNKALQQLAGDAGWASARLQAIGTQFTVLKDQVEVMLKPLGDAIIKPIKTIMLGVNDYLKVHGKEIGDNLGKLIGSIFDDPRKMFVNLMQMKSLGSDFRKALHLTELFQLFMFLKWGLGKIGIELNGGMLRAGFSYLIEGLSALAGWLWRVGAIGKIFGLLRSALVEVIPIFSAFMFFFQIISRARAIAKLADVENLLAMTPRLTALFVRVKAAIENILMPINMAIDFFAKLLAPLFQTSTWLNLLLPLMEGFVSVLELMGQAMLRGLAVTSALTYMWIGFFDDIIKMKNPISNMLGNLQTGYKDWMSQHQGEGDKKNPTALSVTNVGKIEARFDMREQLEPDRIAFAVTTHLKKLAMNPTQGRGNSIGNAFSTPNVAGAQ